MAKKNKTEKEKRLLLTREREQVIQQALRFSKKRFKRFEEVIDRLYSNEDLSFSFSDRRIWKINECFNNFSLMAATAERKTLRDMLVYLDDHSELVSREEYIQAVYNMLNFQEYWRGDLFTWRPRSNHAADQVKELAFYLFCKYNVPDFLYKGFYETKNMQHIKWLILIGSGESIKEIKNFPFPFTKKMGHYFLQAPAMFSITEALRWAQVKGLQGEDALAERIAFSWLATRPYGQEDFWETFLRLLVDGGLFNYNKLTELIDYVREAKRENVNYGFKGRTLQSLIRQSDVWHTRFCYNKGNLVWKPCGIEGYKAKRKKELIVLEELTESIKLSEEGKTMKHCVGSYSFYCSRGKSAIFSLRKYSGGVLQDIMATIEVNIALQKVVQAKAKMNKPISEEARKHMEAWAIEEGLLINPHV